MGSLAPDHTAVFDVIVVGGGLAGLSAALSLYRAQHSTLILDSSRLRSRWATPVRLVSTWEHKDPRTMREEARAELLKTGFVRFVDSEAQTVERTAEGRFRVLDAQDQSWTGHKLLLAVGAHTFFPNIVGYEELFAERIYPCMFQFGLEQRGAASAGLLAVQGLANIFFASIIADDANKFAEHVTIYTDGNSELAEQLTSKLEASTVSADARKISRLEKTKDQTGTVMLHFEDGSSKEEAFLVHRPLTRVNSSLVQQLALDLSETGDIKVQSPFCQTKVKGVYAAGDCAALAKTIPNALTMGAYAACGIARELPRRVTGNSIIAGRAESEVVPQQ